MRVEVVRSEDQRHRIALLQADAVLPREHPARGDAREPGSRKMYYEDKTFDTPGARRFDAGITFGAGYQFRGGITVGLQGDFSLTRFADGGGRNRSGLITLAYNFDSLF